MKCIEKVYSEIIDENYANGVIGWWLGRSIYPGDADLLMRDVATQCYCSPLQGFHYYIYTHIIQHSFRRRYLISENKAFNVPSNDMSALHWQARRPQRENLRHRHMSIAM